MTGEVYESVRAVLHEAANEVMGGKRVRVVPLDLVLSAEDYVAVLLQHGTEAAKMLATMERARAAIDIVDAHRERDEARAEVAGEREAKDEYDGAMTGHAMARSIIAQTLRQMARAVRARGEGGK